MLLTVFVCIDPRSGVLTRYVGRHAGRRRIVRRTDRAKLMGGLGGDCAGVIEVFRNAPDAVLGPPEAA